MTADTLDAYRRAIYEIAEAIAPTWERRRAEVEEVSTPVREWMLRQLRPREGDTVLELAAGVGETGFEAAGIVGEHGRLITSDFSPAMLDAARRRGTELGVKNVEYRVIDAERIKLDADSVDGVLCRFGYMLMADPAAALAENPPGSAPGRPADAGGLGRPGAKPVLQHDRDQPHPARPHRSAGAPSHPWALQHGERGAHQAAASRRRLRRGAHRGGGGAVRGG
jgi:SAM-dependent methyltransferase